MRVNTKSDLSRIVSEWLKGCEYKSYDYKSYEYQELDSFEEFVEVVTNRTLNYIRSFYDFEWFDDMPDISTEEFDNIVEGNRLLNYVKSKLQSYDPFLYNFDSKDDFIQKTYNNCLLYFKEHNITLWDKIPESLETEFGSMIAFNRGKK